MASDTGTYQTFFYFGDLAGGINGWMLFNDPFSAGLGISSDTAITVSTGATALSINTWYHVAITVNGTGSTAGTAYLDGVQQVQHAGNASLTPDTMVYGNNGASGIYRFNGRLASVKVYDAVLTADEILQEMRSHLPYRTDNLNCWTSCVDNVASTADNDYSGNGNNWTPAGTISLEDNPPIHWSQRRNRIFIPAAVAASNVVGHGLSAISFAEIHGGGGFLNQGLHQIETGVCA